jgi:glycosyltransferase involved in cell wall biosynthesis
MNILFVGPYRQEDGWGQAARNLISSLLTTEHDITLRPLYLANTKLFNSDVYNKLEKKSGKFDIIIQNCLPEYFSYTHGAKNIGFFCSETKGLENTPWIKHCNLMDEIWVHSGVEKNELEFSGVKTKVVAIGGAIDISKFQNPPQRTYKEDFVFYFIGNGERKNLRALIIAFHLEFGRNEPVELVIKTSGNEQNIRQYIQGIKQELGLYPNIEQYKQEQIIVKHLTEEELVQLHINGDCFVMPSRGEAWCIPALDAMGFGNIPVVTEGTGMSHFISHGVNGYTVSAEQTPATSIERPLPYIYTGNEYWEEIGINSLMCNMRDAYNDKIRNTEEYIDMVDQCKKTAQYYSFENAGKRLNDIICS